jgi:hypothetical protein
LWVESFLRWMGGPLAEMRRSNSEWIATCENTLGGDVPMARLYMKNHGDVIRVGLWGDHISIAPNAFKAVLWAVVIPVTPVILVSI